MADALRYGIDRDILQSVSNAIDEMTLDFNDPTLWTQEGYSNLNEPLTVKELVKKWEKLKD